MSALATAAAIAFRPTSAPDHAATDHASALHAPRLRIHRRPSPLEALEAAIDLDNVPTPRLEHGLDRLMHDIESFQDPERWDGMS